ncbi:MmgE/PrpD family protein, partial [Schumannella sp. 10F1B-5-1]
MKRHTVRTHRSDEGLERSDELAWKIAQVAVDPVEVEPAVADMIVNRVIDNAAVAAASLSRGPVVAARGQALARPQADARP